MGSRKKDKNLCKCSYCFRLCTTVDELMQHLLNHQTKPVKIPTPSGVLKTEELKIKEKKLPTFKLIIPRCDNLISPGRPFGTLHKSLYKCSYCFLNYSTVDELMQHLLNHQMKQVKLPKTSAVLQIKVPKAMEKKLPTCKLIISRCDNLISPGRPFETIDNGRTNLRRGDDIVGGKLTRPRSEDSESGLANGVTEEVRFRRYSLKQISKCGSSPQVGMNMKPHKCQLCPKSFGQLGHLNDHIRTHTGERPHKCQLCSKSFGQLGHLNEHIRTHTGERPHKCQLCSKSFGRLETLNNHIRTHTGERPHRCQLCSKSFIQQGNLNHHIRTHTGERPHKCQLCSKSFAHPGSLKRHIRTHTGERLRQCQ